MGQRLIGLPPVIDLGTWVLILGSFPGAKSLAGEQYYANSTNQFWRIMEAALEINLVDLPYQQKLVCLLDRGIGLWDVINCCERQGSLDSEIRLEMKNDLSSIRKNCPLMRRLCFNGGKASKYLAEYARDGTQCYALPSSSAANTHLPFKQKVEIWKSAVVIPFLGHVKPIETLKPIPPDFITRSIRATRDAADQVAEEMFGEDLEIQK